MEIRELLSYYNYDGENCPVIYGSALGALHGEIKWEETIGHLVECLDEYIPYFSEIYYKSLYRLYIYSLYINTNVYFPF